MSAPSDAATMLQYYMRLAFNGAGLKWFSDNDAEIETIVGLIIKAAQAGLPELDRECWQCRGAGVIGPPGLTPSAPRDTCGCCKGNGHVITAAGRQVIAFLQRHPAALTRLEG